MKNLYKKIWLHLGKKRKKQFFLLLALTLVSTMFEIVSIGLLLPFLSLLTNPNGVLDSIIGGGEILSWIERALGIGALAAITTAFILITILANLIRLLLMWVTTYFSTNVGGDFGVEIFRNTLNQPYQNIIERNSSELISVITQKINSVTYNSILPIINIISSIVVIFGIFSVLLYINFSITVLLFLTIAIVYFGVVRSTKKKLINNSRRISSQSTHIVKVMQEGLGGIRDIIVDGTQAIYCSEYERTENSLRGALASNLILAVSPRFIIEAIGVSIIALVGYFLSTTLEHGGEGAIPLLGVIALGAQRMLPALQQIYQSWAAIEGGKSSSQEALDMLDHGSSYHNIQNYGVLPFNQNVELRNIDFSYHPHGNQILSSISFEIKKGEHIGIIGKSGSGKSTLIDIFLGLLTPTSGYFFVDGLIVSAANKRLWQSKLTHVSQNIFMIDATILDNIAFGIDRKDINFPLIKKCVEICQLTELIDSWPDGYETIIGERGARISGGQRQRIGIARALYRCRDVVIFDEATSALDSITEEKITSAIKKEYAGITMIFIAHRLSTLKGCSSIIEIDSGKILKICKYSDLESRL